MKLSDFWTVCTVYVALYNLLTVFQQLRYFLCYHGNKVFVAATVHFDQMENCLWVAYLMKYEVT